MRFRYRVVDVFTQTPLEGNPLAVFPEPHGLSDGAMQRIARELNLSETTFVFASSRPGASARVRIFTPAHELTFAGHPTLGTAYVLLDEGTLAAATRRFALEQRVGLVPVRVDEGDPPMLWLSTPPITKGRSFAAEPCARALGLRPDDLIAGAPCRLLSAGNRFIYVAVRDPAAVDRARVDTLALRELVADEAEPCGLFVFAPVPSGAYSRMFAEDLGVAEDPATGSATGPLAAVMMDCGFITKTGGTRFVSEQGTKMGRRSLLHVLVGGEAGGAAIEVGGHTVPVAEATMTLPDAAVAL